MSKILALLGALVAATVLVVTFLTPAAATVQTIVVEVPTTRQAGAQTLQFGCGNGAKPVAAGYALNATAGLASVRVIESRVALDNDYVWNFKVLPGSAKNLTVSVSLTCVRQ